jgi:hypothetical protein
VGHEGSTLFKHDGKYYFGAAHTTVYFTPDGKRTTSYDNVMCVSEKSPYGPYGDRFVAIKNGGNNSLFKDKDGKWYATVWQPTKVPTIVEIEFAGDGTVRPKENYDIQPPTLTY